MESSVIQTPNPKLQIPNKFQISNLNDQTPLTPPSPLGGEGKGEGISSIVHWNSFEIWPACAKPLRRRQVIEIWCFVLF